LRLSIPGALLWLAALLVNTHAAHADPLAVINAIRLEGCAGLSPAGDASPAGTAVAVSAALDDVARELSQTSVLNEAIERTGYPAGDSVAIYLRGPAGDAAVRAIIEDGYCKPVNNPRLNEFGIYRSGAEMWIVLAARLNLPALEDSADIAMHVLELVNIARDQSRQCGSRKFAAAPAVTLSPVLTEVATLHAQDMAQQRVMDHRGSDGSLPAERVTRAGYRWRAVGENVAAGQPNAGEVVAAWLASPEHCANIMEQRFTEMGIAFVVVSGNPATYWAQVFAAPR